MLQIQHNQATNESRPIAYSHWCARADYTIQSSTLQMLFRPHAMSLFVVTRLYTSVFLVCSPELAFAGIRFRLTVLYRPMSRKIWRELPAPKDMRTNCYYTVYPLASVPVPAYSASQTDARHRCPEVGGLESNPDFPLEVREMLSIKTQDNNDHLQIGRQIQVS